MITIWKALRGKLAFFLVGGILGASITSIATPQKTPIELQLQEVIIASARNSEKITDLNTQVEHIYQWIGASDIRSVHDAENMGEMRITIAEHEKLVWMVAANLMGTLVLFGRQLLLGIKKS